MIQSPPADLVLPAGERLIDVRCSTIRDGDFHLDGPRVALAHRRQAFLPGRWTQLDEVHGTTVVDVTSPGAGDGATGDAMVTRCPGAVLAVWVGDCAPLVLDGGDGAVGAVHAGWRGALDGVVQKTAAALGSPEFTAYLGPCIHPCCYEFGDAELDAFADRFGAAVVATTAWGAPALDMRAVVRAAVHESGGELVDRSVCTGCNPQWFYSHRRRGQSGRQVMTVHSRVRS